MEDRRATVPAVQNMVGVSGHLSAWNTRHGSSTVRETGAATQEKEACPLFYSSTIIPYRKAPFLAFS
jgi:hypothetical protein